MMPEDMGGLPPGADVESRWPKKEKTISGLFSLPKTTQIPEKKQCPEIGSTKQK